jgi:hypothetical protein
MKLKIKLVKVTSANTERTIREWPIEAELFKNGKPKTLNGVPDYGNFKCALKEEIER